MITSILVASLVALPQEGVRQEGVPGDTVTLSADQALVRAVERSPEVDVARRRAGAAEIRVEQAGAWPNPLLSITAENVGATRPISGVSGVEGLEGQVVLSGWLPLGGDRSATRAMSEGWASEARSELDRVSADAHLAMVEAWALLERDRARLRSAQEDARGLEALATALVAQAGLGRASEGDAARAHLAMVSGRAAEAAVRVEVAASQERLNRILGLPPGTVAHIDAGACAGPAADAPAVDPPELAIAFARSRVAAAAVSERRASRVPDLVPQVGLRRAGGTSALYLGIAVGLPLFDRGGAAVGAARQEAAAAVAEVDRVERVLAAELEAARRGLAELTLAGAQYDAKWERALQQALASAEARYRLGEGPLAELLDGRRARLHALDGYERWRADLRIQRARVARLSGAPIDAQLVCGGGPWAATSTFIEGEGPR